MAKATFVSKEIGKKSTQDTIAEKTGTFLATLYSGLPDLASVNLADEYLRRLGDIIHQRGEMKGVRFAGAKSHSEEDQTAALLFTVKKGRIPSWSKSAAPTAEEGKA